MQILDEKNKWIVATIAAVVILVAFFAFGINTKANPLDITTSNTTATTSVVYLTAATNSATYTYDSYANGFADPNATELAGMLIQTTASSSSSVYSWNYQFSQDGVDWYDDNTSFLATTSATSTVSQREGYTWIPGVTTRSLKTVMLPATPTRYIRATFYTTAANGSIWATFVTQKQQP